MHVWYELQFVNDAVGVFHRIHRSHHSISDYTDGISKHRLITPPYIYIYIYIYIYSHPRVHSPTVTVKPASPDSVYFVGVTIAEKVMSG